MNAERPGEAEFVSEYRRTFAWPRPAVTLDVVLFTLLESRLRVLLIRRGGHPFKGQLALPGGFLDVGDGFAEQGEGLEQGARRELLEETGLSAAALPLHFFGVFGRPHRDPRMRTITASYAGVVSRTLAARVRAGDDAAEAGFLEVASLRRRELAFDHADMLEAALGWLRARLSDSAVVAPWLPRSFAPAELRALHVLLDSVRLGGAARAPGAQAKQRPAPAVAGVFRRRLRRLKEDGLIVEAGTGRLRFVSPRAGRGRALR